MLSLTSELFFKIKIKMEIPSYIHVIVKEYKTYLHNGTMANFHSYIHDQLDIFDEICAKM